MRRYLDDNIKEIKFGTYFVKDEDNKYNRVTRVSSMHREK